MSNRGLAQTIALPNLPMSNTTVAPNIMLLIDNSGSMRGIIWAREYDDSVIYPNWGYPATDGSITYSSIPRTISGVRSCNSGWKLGRLTNASNVITATKCLKLPDPVGSGNTRYAGNYLNYLFNAYADGTDLTRGQIPNDYRMQVAIRVANNLVTTNPGMRFGVASFNSSQGARINASCGSSTATLTTAISALTASTPTPLAESLYEITRYFRGMPSYYHRDSDGNPTVTYQSPIQYRCQKNFTIVITDGMPTRDTDLPTNDPEDVANTTASLPNWDGHNPTTASSQYPHFPKYSDGFKDWKLSGEDDTKEGFTLLLDDIAKFGHDIDMKKSGTDLAGESFQSQDHPKQNMNTYTVGFAASNQMMKDAAEYGKRQYFEANDEAALSEALNGAIVSIQERLNAAGAIASNTTSLSTENAIYVAKYNSLTWSGTLSALPVDSTGQSSEASWTTDDFLSNPVPDSRVILTYRPPVNNASGRGIPFRWPANTSSLGANEIVEAQSSALGSAAVLNYLRGDRSNELTDEEIRTGAGAGKFRKRAANTVLGDIINSGPQFVGPPVGQYHNPNLFLANYRTRDYLQFRTTNLSRTPMIYVGANDGMLHGFNAGTGVTKGKELLAFVPNAVYPNLRSLSERNYAHKFFVDASPVVADAKINVDGQLKWQTVLVGGLNSGGKSIYALNVTDPSAFSEPNALNTVLWEYSDADLGYTFSRPMIVKTNHNGKWAAIFGNGYNNSGTGTAVLYVVDLSDGTLIQKIDTGVGSAANLNGLASVNAIDMDLNGTVDYIYGGDLRGNMWKFDVSNSNKNNWSIPYRSGNTPQALYVARDSNGNTQPITTPPLLLFNHTNTKTVMVYFGTGKYLESSDKGNTQQQTFYAIWDKGVVVNSVTTRNSATLLRQEITNTSIGGEKFRLISGNHAVDWATQKGWYQDLPGYVPGEGQVLRLGERVVGTPTVINGILFYSTFIPVTDPCTPGGVGFLMGVEVQNGGMPSFPIFDTNGTQEGFGNVPTAGTMTKAGEGGTSIVKAKKFKDNKKIGNGYFGANNACNGGEDCADPSVDIGRTGLRLSWRELIKN